LVQKADKEVCTYIISGHNFERRAVSVPRMLHLYSISGKVDILMDVILKGPKLISIWLSMIGLAVLRKYDRTKLWDINMADIRAEPSVEIPFVL